MKIPPGLPVDAAATVSANPCTAFRMLKDFEDLQPGILYDPVYEIIIIIVISSFWPVFICMLMN